MNIIKHIKFWLNNSRPYTIPITSLSFLVIFVYSLKYGGNITAGLIAYIGVSLVHLATNLSDDYFDYKELIKKPEFCAKDCKCRYLRDGLATLDDLRNVIIILLSIAAICGLFIFFMSGWLVIIFALCVLPVSLFYSKLSSRGLGDLAVITVYGPLMYEGVYYSMTGKLSLEVLVLSFACALFLNTVLYVHMLMDFDDDINAKKITLCTRLKTKDNALKLLIIFYISAFIFINILVFLSGNYYLLLTYFTLPFIILLYQSLKSYNNDTFTLPKVHFWNYPLNVQKELPINAPFFYRFFFVINISTLFMILCSVAIIING